MSIVWLQLSYDLLILGENFRSRPGTVAANLIISVENLHFFEPIKSKHLQPLYRTTIQQQKNTVGLNHRKHDSGYAYISLANDSEAVATFN